MANPLARQMLNNLARKAGQEIPEDRSRAASSPKVAVRLETPEEQLLVDLIYRRQKLHSEEARVDIDSGLSSQPSQHGMLSLAELAAKARHHR
ncbi:MAG: hypothetical protein SCK57_01905 [Bacillota bacterium]|nr:hypothetical protein [Bacillota bacterium]MDW7676399.1 hypothetical protein [Bacillota bacterium]